jgi:acyl carrier protein
MSGMGLDLVEFVMAVEEAFGIAIPDEDAQELLTPGDLVRYLERRLGQGEGSCLEQRAFYSLRRAGMSVLRQPRGSFRPDTRWDAILPSKRRRRAWQLLHHATGVVPWPRLSLWGSIEGGQTTLGDTARYLATHAAVALQRPGVGWSRAQIEAGVRQLMAENLGVADFDWEQKFVDDLGAN